MDRSTCLEGPLISRAKSGQAISAARRTPESRAELASLLSEAKAKGDLALWRRAQAVTRYLDGVPVLSLVAELGVTRGAMNKWNQWFEAQGAAGLRGRKAPGPAPKLTEGQRAELCVLVEAGPQAAGFTNGVWTGPMIGQLIRERFGVSYHNHHVPYLLNQLGFSVQRPRKRLARADVELQQTWLRERFPEIKKKPTPAAE